MSDKYPSETGRRRFVKGVVGSAALAGVGAGGASTIDLATQPQGGGGGITPFVGIEQTGGPAPRGMPFIPLEVDDEGYFRGLWPEPEEVTEQGQTYQVARMELGGETYSSEWYQYCGRQQAGGVHPSADQDNYFRAIGSPSYDWQSEELDEGDRINVDDLADYEEWGNDIGQAGVGKPADATWRSEGTDGVLPVTLIRSPIIEEKAQEGGRAGDWYEAASAEGTIAYLNVCTHFCCVPGYKTAPDSANYNAEDGVYCQCHQSTYDPFTPEFGQFIALPRPQDSGSGGRGGGGESGGGGEGGEGEGGGDAGGEGGEGGGEGGGGEGGGGEGGSEGGGGEGDSEGGEGGTPTDGGGTPTDGGGTEEGSS